MSNKTQEIKYLTIKTNAIIQKLKEKYENIIIFCVENDPGNLRIGFQSWGPSNKIIYVIGNKNENSYWINSVSFKNSVKNNGVIEPNNLYREFEDLCLVIDILASDYIKLFRNL
jgi:hypothetical protein